MKYDKYDDRFELGDTVLYDGKTRRITSRSYQPKGKMGLVNDNNENIEVNVKDNAWRLNEKINGNSFIDSNNKYGKHGNIFCSVHVYHEKYE